MSTETDSASLSKVGDSGVSTSAVPAECSFTTDIRQPDKRIEEVPQGSGSFLSFVNLKWYGYNFYRQKKEELKSSVFEINLFGSRVVICDLKSIQSLVTNQNIVKDPGFGLLMFDEVILPSYTPTIFANAAEHERKKGAVLKYVEMLGRNLNADGIASLVRSEMQKLSFAGEIPDFEKAFGVFMGNVLSTILVGQALSNDDIEVWLSGVFKSSFRWFSGHAKFLNAYKSMYSKIKSSPLVEQMANGQLPAGYSEDELIKEIIFMLVFNAYGALKNLGISCVAMLHQLHQTDLERLREDAILMYSSKPVAERFKTPFIDGFVYEIVRLFPPAHSVFGRAANDFVLESESGNFQIRKDQTLCGFFYEAQRDPSVFPDPDKINIHRYTTNSSILQYILSFGGRLNALPTVLNHKCPGQNIAISVLKALVASLVFSDIEFEEKPVWTGASLARLAASDKPLRIRSFAVRDIRL